MDINSRHERYCDNDCNRIYIDVKIQSYHAYLILLGIYFDEEDIFSGVRWIYEEKAVNCRLVVKKK